MVAPLVSWASVCLKHVNTSRNIAENSREGAISTFTNEDTSVINDEEYLMTKAHIITMQQVVASNLRSIDGLKMKLKSHCDELKEKTEKIASLEEDILTKKSQVSCLQLTNESKTEMIVELNEKIKDFEDRVISLN